MDWLKAIVWKVVNVLQVLFFIFWSILWQTVSVLIRPITGPSVPLKMARTIWGGPIAAVVGCRFEKQARGFENVDYSKPHIFVFNHQSTADIGVAFLHIPVNLRFVAKQELKYVPFLGWYMWATDMIFVDRSKSDKAIKSLREAGRLIREGASVVAFPEGTRSSDGTIAPFKKGIFVVAIESGVPVVPCAIEGSRHVWPKNTFRFRPHPIRVAIGKPIPTEGLSYEDREVLVEEVHDAVVDLHLTIGGLGEGSSAPIELPENESEKELAAAYS